LSELPATERTDFADLYNNSPCGYLTIFPSGSISGANLQAAKWLGYDRAQLCRLRLSDILSLNGRVYWETHLRPLLRVQGEIDGVALDFVTAASAKLSAFASAIEMRDAAGKVVELRLAFFQAEERRAFEQSLLNARAVSEERLRSERETAELREQFIAVLGHDLRNPLASIDAGLRMVLKTDDMARVRTLSTMMQASVGRMSKLIDDVLDFARGRLGSGLALNRFGSVDLRPALEQVVAELQAAHPETAITADLDLAGSIECDPARIAQMASNLIANAITHGAPAMPVKVQARSQDGRFELSVSNAGEPIPSEVATELFKPFVRASARPSQQGLGLGLYICSEIAKAHGATLSVSSTIDETRFTFRMPEQRKP
jgi:sigma-B regulation protein RsbU (phosphoserine phosphatase)